MCPRARPGRQHVQAQQEFALGQHGLARRHAELLDRHLARPVGPGDDAHRFVGDERRNRVRGRRGIAQVAADAGPALDLDAADQRDGVH